MIGGVEIGFFFYVGTERAKYIRDYMANMK